MADELRRIKLSDTPKDAVEAINRTIAQTEDNKENISDLQLQLENFTGTDTKNTTGATKKTNVPLYLVGSETTGDSPVTYSSDAYMKNGQLYSTSPNNAEINPVLTQFDYDNLVRLIGDIVGGMRFKGTLGVGGNITSLPTSAVNVEDGDVYKVITDGQYAGEQAEVGDLFIASVVSGNVIWHLVPSGDDGDVYADDPWTSEGEVMVSASGDVASKKIKRSYYKISGADTSFSGTTGVQVIPTAYAVKIAMEDRLAFSIPFSVMDTFTDGNNDTGYRFILKKSDLGTLPNAYTTLYNKLRNAVAIGVFREPELVSGSVLGGCAPLIADWDFTITGSSNASYGEAVVLKVYVDTTVTSIKSRGYMQFVVANFDELIGGSSGSGGSGGSSSENRPTFSTDMIEIPGYANAGTGAYNITAEFLDLPDEEYNVIKLTANAGETIKYVEFSVDGTYYSQDGLMRADPDDGSFNITNLSGTTTILYTISADDVSTVMVELNRDVTIRSITVWK